ncbi:MAG: twin-arginine translocase TatA/TatE family subunit [Magnetococcales bacterium]|nr:twin-arginine translocase TatA/TatE family subunit [Magnetococcales bacterium]MBF0605338.1 twin-arginine translocase TatA/TatE family subunit [Magnetococcales bacterium]HAT50283.1 twin-arginine translocase TatA/TatE family subunit [Alphaproteobacteria bacterium]
MFGLGTSELIIILVIVLVVFGAGKLPKVMKDLGKGVKSFKDAMVEKDEVVDSITQTKTLDNDSTPRKENT